MFYSCSFLSVVSFWPRAVWRRLLLIARSSPSKHLWKLFRFQYKSESDEEFLPVKFPRLQYEWFPGEHDIIRVHWRMWSELGLDIWHQVTDQDCQQWHQPSGPRPCHPPLMYISETIVNMWDSDNILIVPLFHFVV